VTSAIFADLTARLRMKQDEERRSLARYREEVDALRREITVIKKLLAEIRNGRLEEKAMAPAEIVARSQRDRDRNARIQDAFASANRRITALRARKAAGKPSGAMDAKKAQKEAERVRKLDQQATDIRATANAGAADIRSKIGD
jgi:hypothetical protein